jgi:hypothetical protein
MKNLLFLSILICMGCLRLVAQPGVPSLSRNHEPRSCSLLNPQSNQANHVDDFVLFNAYNLQANSIRSLHLVATVRAEDAVDNGISERAPELPVVIDFVDPDLIRATVVASFAGSRRFEMASDGKEIRLLMPREGKTALFVGPVDAPLQLIGETVNISFQSFIDALHWPVGKRIAGEQPLGSSDTDARMLKVDLSPGGTGPHSAHIEFDLIRGQVNSVATYDSAGELISKAKYSEWQEVAISPSGSSQGCLPRHIEFVIPKQNYKITLQVSEIVLNSEIPRRAKGIDAVKATGSKNDDSSQFSVIKTA